MDKRGLTPLMATFLFVSFAVAVGVVVMNVVRAEVEEAAQCALDVGLRFSVVENREPTCYDTQKRVISFAVENGININIDGLIVNVIGTEKAETFELTQAKLLKAGAYEGTLPYDLALSGKVRQVKITPKITPVDQEIFCPEQALIVENMKSC